jgi:hypothetical protein
MHSEQRSTAEAQREQETPFHSMTGPEFVVPTEQRENSLDWKGFPPERWLR